MVFRRQRQMCIRDSTATASRPKKYATMRSARALRRCLSTTKDWRAVATREAKKAGTTLDNLTSTTKESLEIQPCYFGNDDEAAPGVFPYRRGAYATMYAAKPWTVRQYAGFSSAEESNAFYRNAVKEGQQGLSVAFDLPSHRGYDSDHPRAQGDVGLAGVPVDTVEFGHILLAEAADELAALGINGKTPGGTKWRQKAHTYNLRSNPMPIFEEDKENEVVSTFQI